MLDQARRGLGRSRRRPVRTAPGGLEGEARPTRHGPLAQLLIAWSPLSAILGAYAVAQWVSAPLGEGDGAGTNRLGFALHVAGPAQADRAVFGAVPTVWVQERLADGSAQWYDAVAALVYVTHYISLPLLTGVVWFCVRERFRSWLATVLVFTVVGIGGYVVYPAAPPWIASEQGAVGRVVRISALGWDQLHLDVVADLIARSQDGTNPVAAMPSLHAGAALLVALFVWPVTSVLWRTVLLAYALSMAATLVYTGEHYVVDVAAGWLTAAVALAVGALVHRHRTRGRTQTRTRTRTARSSTAPS